MQKALSGLMAEAEEFAAVYLDDVRKCTFSIPVGSSGTFGESFQLFEGCEFKVKPQEVQIHE